MEQYPSYDNDETIRAITDAVKVEPETVLNFILSKRGKVYYHSFNEVTQTYSRDKNGVIEALVQLYANGLIKYEGTIWIKATKKAKWEKFRDSENTKWIIVAIGILLAALALR